MSDVKDEIDWEFPGAATTQGQSNFFWQGVIRAHDSFPSSISGLRYCLATQDNGQTHKGLSDTFSNYHDYTVSLFRLTNILPYIHTHLKQIDWQPDALTFSIDGKVQRTVKKSDTVGSNGVANYPSTPSRIQLSYVFPFDLRGCALNPNLQINYSL